MIGHVPRLAEAAFWRRALFATLLLVCVAACGSESEPARPAPEAGAGQGGETLSGGAAGSSGGAGPDVAGAGPDVAGAGPDVAGVAPYATRIVSFEPGENAGYGENELPEVVLGPPSGKGNEAGSLEVLSLGKGGSIVLGFEPLLIADREGGDFVVFENSFWPGGDPSAVFAEPGEVSVSEDGDTWLTFPCDAAGDGAGHFAGCAGVTPTLVYDAAAVIPLDPAVSGGDAFDLADVGLERARFVRIRDATNMGAGKTAGFDLDAVGIVNAAANVEP